MFIICVEVYGCCVEDGTILQLVDSLPGRLEAQYLYQILKYGASPTRGTTLGDYVRNRR